MKKWTFLMIEAEEMNFFLTLPMLRLLLSKAQGLKDN